jgi:hypothetical protein
MSEAALVKGVVSRLRTAFGDSAGAHVFPSDDLKPPPGTSTFRTAPYCVTVGRASSVRGDTRSGDVNDQVYTLSVCVTAWLGHLPQDRQAHDIFSAAPNVTDPATAAPPSLFAQSSTAAEDTDGIAEVADQIIAHLAEDWDTVSACNAQLGGYDSDTNGFIEPFHNHAKGDAQNAGGDWVGSEDKVKNEVKTLTVTLSGMRRIRVRGTL